MKLSAKKDSFSNFLHNNTSPKTDKSLLIRFVLPYDDLTFNYNYFYLFIYLLSSIFVIVNVQ